MNRYNKAMSKIKVTPEMHKRIIKNIEETDFETGQKKNYLYQTYKKYFPIAACLLICMAGTLFLPDILIVDQQPPVQVSPIIAEYASKNELSSAIGFEVKEINRLPFDVEQIQYISYEKEFAETVYTGSSNSLVFRMSKGDNDISGDYREYEEMKIISAGYDSITIKGNNSLYSLATWKDNAFSYSVQLNNGISETDLTDIIRSIK